MRILLTGATGFIGRALCARLSEAHQVVAVTRDVERARRKLGERAEARPLPQAPAEWAAALEGCDAVVNLAGESIASGRWTDERKRQIIDSRVGLTRALVEAIDAAPRKPQVLVSASAVGYYGDRGDQELDESAAPGSGFLAEVCKAWESAARPERVRMIHLRIGVVLGEGGGALERMAMPFKLYLGGPLGSGRQWMSWIHRDDVIGLIELALADDRARGPLNATAPEPQTMRELCRTLGKVLDRPSWAPVPSFVLRLALGEMSEMLLSGQRVVPAAARALGYEFKYPELEAALRASLRPA